jgi:hypothetical protein
MCFNMVVVNPRRVSVRELVSSVYGKAVYNRHGFSVYTLRSDGEELVLRTLDFEEFKRFVEENVDDNVITHIHFRQATSGSINEKNIHMWRVECGASYYYVSHNGYVERYARPLPIHANARVLLAGESDTLRFISNPSFCPVLSVERDGLGYVLGSGFYGVLFATNKSRVIVLSRGKPAQVCYDDSSGVLIFANEEISYKFEVVSAYGFTFARRGLFHAKLSDVLLSFSVDKMAVEKYIDIMEYTWLTRWGYWKRGKVEDEWLD